MTDEAVLIDISSNSGGMENEVEIRDEQDLQVAVEALQLAARYEFEEWVGLEFDSDSTDDEMSDLVGRVEQLDEELDSVEDDVGELIEDVSDSVEKEDVEEIRESIQELKDEVDSLLDQSSQDREKQENEESSDDSSREYTCSDCGKSFDSVVETRSTHHDCNTEESEEEDTKPEEKKAESGKEECPHCGDEFDPRGLNNHEPNCSENPENHGEESSVDRNAEAISEDAPEPNVEEEDDSASDVDPERVDDSSTPVDSSKDVEWKSINEAVGEYKDDHGLKYLINREHEKRYTSPMLAQSFASTNDAEDWAAVEELPEGF